MSPAGLLVVADQQGVGGQHHRREVGGAQQGPAHLLQHDDLLHEAEPLAAVGLGHGQPLQAHLVGHLVPHVGVVAPLGVHLLPHRRLGRLVGQEVADEAAELVLLLGEGEVQGFLPSLMRPASIADETARA